MWTVCTRKGITSTDAGCVYKKGNHFHRQIWTVCTRQGISSTNGCRLCVQERESVPLTDADCVYKRGNRFHWQMRTGRWPWGEHGNKHEDRRLHSWLHRRGGWRWGFKEKRKRKKAVERNGQRGRTRTGRSRLETDRREGAVRSRHTFQAAAHFRLPGNTVSSDVVS